MDPALCSRQKNSSAKISTRHNPATDSAENLDDFEIYEDVPDHHFRTEIPNIIFELPLEPTTLFVYMVLKRIAGDHGKCWKSIKNLAQQCKMGETSVRRALNQLSLLDGFWCDDVYISLEKPLIEIIQRKRDNGGNDTNIIKINSVWKVNGDYYRRKRGGGSPNEGGGVRQTKGGGSPNEPKEEQQKKNTYKKQQQTPAASVKKPAASAVVFFECTKGIGLTEKEQKSLMKYPEAEVQEAVKFATNPKTKIKTTLIKTIMWALKEKPDVPEIVDVKENKKHTEMAENLLTSDHWVLHPLSKSVQIYSKTPTNPTVHELKYDEENYKTKLEGLLKSLKFKRHK